MLSGGGRTTPTRIGGDSYAGNVVTTGPDRRQILRNRVTHAGSIVSALNRLSEAKREGAR